MQEFIIGNTKGPPGPEGPPGDSSMFLTTQVEGMGRCLMKVLLDIDFATLTTQAQRNEVIAQVMAEIRRRCNNNGEIDGSGIPDFTGLMVGDFIDGLDLSGIEDPPGGSAPQPWSNSRRNNRLLIGGFNTYLHSGQNPSVSRNHITFTTRHNIAIGRMNATNANAGGYAVTELRQWLEGASGDGSGPFAKGIKAALGGNEPLLTIGKILPNATGSWQWHAATVFPPSTIEVFGAPGFAEVTRGDATGAHLPIYQDSTVYRVKRWNGARSTRWLRSPSGINDTSFCTSNSLASNSSTLASELAGVGPVFCVV